MIENIIFAVLGFLVAAGLAMAIAPALWRRAEYLERRRIEAALPLTREELEAEIDSVRAERAMSIRRLEVKAEAMSKKAAQDLITINLLNDRIRDLQEECAVRDASIQSLEHEREALKRRLADRDEELQEHSAQIAELTRNLADQMNEFHKLSRLQDDLNILVSTQKIDLVARETEIERLNNGVSLLRTQRREADRATREARAEKAELETALRLERSRVEDLQGRVERLLRDLSTNQHMLERRERELGLLHPEAPAAVASSSPETTPVASGRDEADQTAILQQRIDRLTAANKRRRSRKGQAAVSHNEALREEISSIAALMVRMVADREGPDSPVEKALAGPVREVPGVDREARPESLADRVQKLRAASR